MSVISTVNNLSLGTDLVEISRIRSILSSDHSIQFKNRVYTTSEQAYCDSKSDPIIHYAGRFAAKEAIRKAVMSHPSVPPTPPFQQIEILSDTSGAPVVSHRLPLMSENQIVVSISHTESHAIATAIIFT